MDKEKKKKKWSKPKIKEEDITELELVSPSLGTTICDKTGETNSEGFTDGCGGANEYT